MPRRPALRIPEGSPSQAIFRWLPPMLPSPPDRARRRLVRACPRLVALDLRRRYTRLSAVPSAGMTTAEYAVGTLAACAFAAVLIAVVRSPEVKSALASVIQSALSIAT